MPAESGVYDLAIIGGGIAGAAIAREARKKNLRVILFEKNTVGSGTSSKSSKLIHGGLRYLETAWSALLRGHVLEFWKNLRFVFLALRETHLLAKEWPGLIQEIELLMPLYKNTGRSKWAVFFGTWVYGFFSFLSGGRLTRLYFSKETVLQAEPGLKQAGLTGAALVFDYTTNDLALVQAVIQDAQKRGADVFEHTEVTSYSYDRSTRTFSVHAAGDRSIQAKHVINASGAWVDRVRKNAGGISDEMIVPVAGAHIETLPFTKRSAILQASDGRIFFVLNREGRTRIGTTERLHHDPDHVTATEEEIKYLLESVKKFFPEAPLSSKAVLCSDAGIRPLAKPAHARSAGQISREHEFIFDKEGAVHVLGVKLTDHRRAAVDLLKALK